MNHHNELLPSQKGLCKSGDDYLSVNYNNLERRRMVAPDPAVLSAMKDDTAICKLQDGSIGGKFYDYEVRWTKENHSLEQILLVSEQLNNQRYSSKKRFRMVGKDTLNKNCGRWREAKVE